MKTISKFEEDAQKVMEKTIGETTKAQFKAMRRVAPGIL
jgi:hypothetical protein